ncbi:MAG: YggT family protein [Clostridia bacterium]|nr:YggT family protein [Clostridia bacterium]MBR5284666.1 YggT family protein [Clostridia bacterium]
MLIYSIVRQVAYNLLSLLQLAMLVRALMSWIPSLRGSALDGILYQITEPIIEPFRQLLWKIPGLQGFPLDLSFLAAYITLNILMEIL